MTAVHEGRARKEKDARLTRRSSRFPELRRLLSKIFDRLTQVYNRRHIRIIKSLPLFAPISGGSHRDIAAHTIVAANQVFPFINHLMEVAGQSRFTNIRQVGNFCAGTASEESASQLQRLLEKYGSDKGTDHDYHLIYGAILKNKLLITKVLEIGLGTNNTDVVSHMGTEGRPGASIRAFRDFLPNALIFGADVDRRILFEEERIRTFYVDQTDLHSFDELGKNIGDGFDLIIDDGLHSPNANIAVLSFALRRLKRGGWLVIEDISNDALPLWNVVVALLPSEYKVDIVSGRKAFAFVVERGSPADSTDEITRCGGDIPIAVDISTPHS